MFLLYTGFFSLIDILPEDLYDHFMQYFVALTILVSPRLSQEYLRYASDLLRSFVQHHHIIYGVESLVYNVHSLIHLPDDVAEYGHLDRYSAFVFEDHMKSLKKMVRKPHLPLQQVCRHLHENTKKTSILPERGGFVLKKVHTHGPLDGLVGVQYEEVKLEDKYCIATKECNCCFGLIDRWKATEFRLFLLYTVFFSLIDILPQDLYDHFMQYFVALTILVSQRLSQEYLGYASDLLRSFVQHHHIIYGLIAHGVRLDNIFVNCSQFTCTG